MKKIIFIALLLCSCSLLFGCNEQENKSFSQSNMSFQVNIDTPQSSENNALEDDYGKDEKFLIIEDLDDYQKYVSNEPLIENFIDYDTVSQFGNFDAFTVPSVMSLEHVGEYWYDFVDDYGATYALHVYHNFKEPEQPYKLIENIDESVNSSDLRTVNTNEAGVYEKNGITYFYSSKGTLTRVRWNVGNVVVFLSGSNISKTPLDSKNPSAIGKLLNDETAKDVLTIMFGEKNTK